VRGLTPAAGGRRLACIVRAPSNMTKPAKLISKLCLSAAMAFGTFILLGLAAIAASLYAPRNLFTALLLGLLGSFLIIGIIRTWRKPDGWRFALIVAAVSLFVWADLAYGPSYLLSPVGSRVATAP